MLKGFCSEAPREKPLIDGSFCRAGSTQPKKPERGIYSPKGTSRCFLYKPEPSAPEAIILL